MTYKIIYFVFAIGLFYSGLCAQETPVDFEKKSKVELDKIRNKTKIDLTGIWQGEVSQMPWLGMPDFENEDNGLGRVEIKQDGNKITGKLVCNARFANGNGKLYYVKYFEGFFDGKTFYYRDTKVENYKNSHRTMRRLETCMKTAELDFYIKDGNYYLEGRWTGYGHISKGRCSPGEIKWRKMNPEEEKENPSVEVNFEKLTPKKEVKYRKDKTVKKLKDRKVSKEGKRVRVKSTYITLEVYDHKKSDGDIISLNYNGQWILENHQIDDDKHTVDLLLDESLDKNFLILHAHNLGEVPPNTAAIIIDDGYRKQKFVLNSDLDKSDILYFSVLKK